MNEENLKTIQAEMDFILSQLSIDGKALVNKSGQEDGELISVQIETLQPASLIGFHGETLQALQLIFSFLCHKITGQWVKVLVNVGDYRQKREEQLQRLVLNLAMKAKFSKEAQSIPNLSASERRFVHLILADHPDVYSQSEGEGKQRLLYIKPKK